MTTADIDKTPSRPFKGFDWSEHENVVRLVESLFAEYTIWYKKGGENKRIRDAEKIKQHLMHFVLEAYRTHKALLTLTMGVHLGNRYYSEGKGGRYHPVHLSYRVVINVITFLTACGYLEMPFGKSGWEPKEKDRRTTRYRATPKLISLCDEYGVNRFMIIDYPYREPEIIILRKKKKRGKSGDFEDYNDIPFTVQARKNLKQINDYIARHHLNLDITDVQHSELQQRLSRRDDEARGSFIDFTKTKLKRIFNNSSFEDGGRLYGGWWQQIPGDYRIFITINSKKTIQLDYSGMHFSIMYAAVGITCPMEDPYALKGYGEHLRKDIKTAFNIIINCDTKQKAIRTIDGRIKKGKLSSELGSGEKLIHAFIDTHPLIKDKIASGEGVKGQFTDSQVAERILLKGIDLNLCILPIHDGFITTTGDQYILEKLMDEAFEEITGYKALNKPETFQLSVLEKKGTNQPYLITRPDGSIEKDGVIDGKGISFSETLSSEETIWDRLKEDADSRKIKNEREKEWKQANGHYK